MQTLQIIIYGAVAIFLLLVIILPSIKNIGQTEVGLVSKRFGRKLPEDNPIAMKGEAGYQAELLKPGFRFKFWILYSVRKFPWVQVPAGEIGVVISQTGKPLPIGAKSAIYKPEFGTFTDLRTFLDNGGQKGVQRPVLSPGSLAPIHPIGFLVITKNKVYGLPIDPEIKRLAGRGGELNPQSFGLDSNQLKVVNISPQTNRGGKITDIIGIVTTYEGSPLDASDIAGRLGGFKDMEKAPEGGTEKTDAELVEMLLSNKNNLHNNYQDFQAFLDNGGRIGLQHDPLLYGAYTLNPFLVKVEEVPMLIVEQGEVAVIKSYVGLVTEDTSGSEFKFGSLVRPGHRGIWREALRTGKYPINPHCYQAEVVPTSILTLNWAEATSKAHNLDSQLEQIVAKSKEGFIFKIDLQVQIHIPDTDAPSVISMVGTIANLVNEVLQAAVGNHFRDKLQSLPAIKFIETRQLIQEEAYKHIESKLKDYKVETRGVYIQDVVLPEELVQVLTQREIANQEIETYKKKKAAQMERIDMENAEGKADKQKDLAASEINIKIKTNNAEARKAEADGESTYIEKIGKAKGAEVRSVGMAKAEAYKEQVSALGADKTALVNVLTAMAENGIKIMPETLIVGSGSSAMEGVAAAAMNLFKGMTMKVPTPQNKPVADKEVTSPPASEQPPSTGKEE